MSFANIEAEQQLLGAILTNNRVFDSVSDLLHPNFFADPVHARIWKACQARISKGHLVSPVVLKSLMGEDEGLKELGGPGYLARLAGASIAAYAARDYAGMIVADAARRMIDAAAGNAAGALASGEDPYEISLKLQAALQELPDPAEAPTSISLAKAVAETIERAASRYRGDAPALRTGVPGLDSVIRGLEPGDFMLIGGSTSMGKSSLALHIADNVASTGAMVAFASLEMSHDQIADRLISSRARIPYAELRDASSMSERDFERWVRTAPAAAEPQIEIIPRHIRDIPAIHSACRRIAARKPLSLLVIDYLQLVRGQGKGRYEQMTDVSISTKALAGLLGIPVIGLVQLDRNLGAREDSRPQLNDIKETGQFENDADQVAFCHREGYWLQRKGPKADKGGNISDQSVEEWEADMAAWKNKMEVIVRKNRHGALGSAKVGFHEATNRFWSLEEGHIEQEGFNV